MVVVGWFCWCVLYGGLGGGVELCGVYLCVV